MSREKKIPVERPRNPVGALLWLDAGYSFEKRFPGKFPQPQITAGFIIESNKDYINIATNVKYNEETDSIWPVDGFVIPGTAILKFKKLTNFNEAPQVKEK